MRALLASVLALTACGAKVKVAPMPTGDMDDPEAGAPAPRADDRGSIDIKPAAPVKVAPPGAGVRSVTISRAALDAAIDAGPGAFLHGFEVVAVLDQGKFAGWRLVRFMEDEHRFDGLDLQPGDVLLDVNGLPVSQPDQLSALFDSLRGANTIVFDLARQGASFQLKVTVAAPPHP